MDHSRTKLLKVACDIAGGHSALAQRLEIRESLLSRFMSGHITLPDELLLRALDIMLEDHEARSLAKPSVFPYVPSPGSDD